MLHQTLETFGIKKSRTSAYHPEGDGMVERFNCTLLQLLLTYTETQDEWEAIYLLYYLHTAQQCILQPEYLHLNSCLDVHQLQNPFPALTAYNALSYWSQLWTKLAHLSDFVETHLAQAAHKQKTAYD